MARLIPGFFDDSTPPGERDVFNLLAGGPDNWTALHSLDIAPWNQHKRTEVDFILIMPEAGILCIEVKSQTDISFTEQGWSPPSIKRSPFKQALDARYAFRRGIKEVAGDLATVPILHLCIFPRARFDIPSLLAAHKYELIDSLEFKQFMTSEAFCSRLLECIREGVRDDSQIKPLGVPLTAHQVERIVRSCVPIQKIRVDKRAEIDQRAANAASILRTQQKPVLMLTDMNDRVIISGGAGTGKTLIAMEVARRHAERGARVALLCFNKLVGDWMSQSISQSGQPLPNLVAGRAIQVMAEMADITIPSDPGSEFWETTLPNALESRLTDPDFAAVAQFDYLVIDEAQDILSRPTLWQCLTAFLRGGLTDGKFALFGDFEHQVLNSPDDLRKSLAEVPQCVKAALSENCRNYPIVGNTAVQLSGLGNTVYTGFMRTGGSLRNYDIAFYENDQEQLNQLRVWLREFRDHGYRPSEISVLSFCKPETSAAVKLSREGFSLSPLNSGTKTLFTSVHAFKGMENKVIILTDVRIENADFHRNVFYTGMTRATDSVRVLCSQTSQATLMSWLTGSAE